MSGAAAWLNRLPHRRHRRSGRLGQGHDRAAPSPPTSASPISTPGCSTGRWACALAAGERSRRCSRRGAALRRRPAPAPTCAARRRRAGRAASRPIPRCAPPCSSSSAPSPRRPGGRGARRPRHRHRRLPRRRGEAFRHRQPARCARTAAGCELQARASPAMRRAGRRPRPRRPRHAARRRPAAAGRRRGLARHQRIWI